MRIITVQFDYPGHSDYKRLLKAFQNSCKVHAPDADFTCLKRKPPTEMKTRKRSFASNAIKLKAWVEELEKDTTDALLVDCDMLMTAPIDDVWEMDFDIAYTYREEGNQLKVGPKYEIVDGRKIRLGAKPHPDAGNERTNSRGSKWPPINGGVMFIRPNERSLAFMRKQLQINDMMMQDKTLHERFRKVYAGINQAAFGYMIELMPVACSLRKLCCTEWNSCDGTWLQYKKGFTRMLHIKSNLRKYVLDKRAVPKPYMKLVNMWKRYEKGDDK